MITQLYPFQEEGVRLLEEREFRAILGDEVGLGKTIQSLKCAEIIPKNPSGPIVCVVPSHLKGNWKREAQKHLNLRVEILSGQRVPSEKLPPLNRNHFYVINYDVLVPPHWKSRTLPPEDSWLHFLSSLHPRMLIADEAHYLQNPSAIRTRAVRRMAGMVPHLLLLTGTPMANTPMNLWSLLNMIDRKAFPSHFDFGTEFTNAKRKPWGWEFKGARNLDRLNVLLQRYMVRRRKVDVLKQLPILTRSVLPIEVDLREYRKAETEFLTWLAEQDPNAAARAASAEELSRMNELKRLAGRLKVDSVARWALELIEETGGKLLLGAIHKKVTYPLMDAFGKQAILVDGDLSDKEKDAATKQFNLDPKCRILVGNLQAAGTGWSCKATSDVALAELPWRPADCIQFEGRVDGIERGIPGTAAHARYLVADQTIESDLCEVLSRKQRWSDRALDGRHQTDGSDFDVHAQVKKMMQERAKRKEAV